MHAAEADGKAVPINIISPDGIFLFVQDLIIAGRVDFRQQKEAGQDRLEILRLQFPDVDKLQIG